jgi:hypothetical protein
MDELPLLLSVVSKIISAISLSADFRFYVFSDFQPSEIDFPSCLLDFFDFVGSATLISIRNRISFSMSALPLAMYDTKISGQTTFWRRVLFLLAYFDAAANFMTQTLFQNVEFHDENLPLMAKYIRGFERPPFADLGALFVRTFYAVEQVQMTDNLLRIWRLLFAQENLTDTSVTLFGEYVLPANYPPGQAPLIASRFPFLDKSNAYCLPPDSGQHYQNFSVLQWKDRKFGQRNFTTIGLEPIDSGKVLWFMRREAEEINLRFRLEHTRFDRGLRILLQKLQTDSPVVDLSLMFSPKAFFGELRHNFFVKNKCNPDHIGFLLTNEDTGIAVENLIVINATCDEDGKFVYMSGSRRLKVMFIKVVKIDPEMAKIYLYRKGSNIAEFHVYPKNALPIDSVFLLTAFTTPLK